MTTQVSLTCDEFLDLAAGMAMDAIDQRDVERVEHHAAFPNRTNVQLAHATARDRVELLIWERGAGETQASGSSACAARTRATVTLTKLSGQEESQVLNYLKATQFRVGVLINFGSTDLLDWKRFVK